MAATAALNIVLKAIDQASGVLGKVNSSAGKLKTNFTQLTQQIPGLNSAMALATNPITLVGTGLVKVAQFASDASKETVAYTKTVRDMAQNLNLSTEETSRLIQTADDYGVTIGQVEDAMRMALKNGFAPSIDTLADMADKYNELESPTERAAALTEVFGRNWSSLTPMLKEGGQAIREAAAAQSDSLLVTEASAQAARDNEIAVDAWNDTLQGITYTVGNEVIPILTDLTTALSTNVSGGMGFIQALKDGDITMADWIATGYRVTFTSETMADANAWLAQKIKEAEEAAKSATDTGFLYNKILEAGKIAADDDADATERMAYAIYEVNDAALGKAAIDALNEAYKEGDIDAANYEAQLRLLLTDLMNMDPLAIEATIRMGQLNSELQRTGDVYAYATAISALKEELAGLAMMQSETDFMMTWTKDYAKIQAGAPVTAGYKKYSGGGGGGGGGGGRSAAEIAAAEAEKALREMERAAEEAARAVQEELNFQLQELSGLMDNQLSDSLDNFNEKMGDLQGEAAKIKKEIDRLNAKEWLGPQQKSNLEDLKDQYAELQQTMRETADEHEEASKRMIFDLISQRAALDGLTSAELQLLSSVAMTWGLVDQKMVDTTNKVDLALSQLGQGASIEYIINSLSGLGQNTNNWNLTINEAGRTVDPAGSFTMMRALAGG